MTLQLKDISLSIADKKLCNQLDVEFKPGEFWASWVLMVSVKQPYYIV